MESTNRSRKSHPTMADVAKVAGVSLKTVSRVVNGADYVSADKAERVRAVIEEIGFRPNEYARHLRSGTSATIGLIIEDIADPFYAAVARSIEEVAFSKKHLLVTASSAEDPIRARDAIDSLSSRGVQAMIVAPAEGMEPAWFREKLETGMTFVFIDRPVPGVEADTLLVDNEVGARRGTEHLIAQGHRRIAFVGDRQGVYTASKRFAGYCNALLAAGLPLDDDLVVMESPEGPGVDQRLTQMLTSDWRPTAIFAGNNRWTVRLLRALRLDREQHKIALVGFDDFELSDVLSPAVSVVAQDPSTLGRKAAELLFERISGALGPSRFMELSTKLTIREPAKTLEAEH